MLAFDDEGNEISLAPAKETRSEPVTQTAHQGLDPEKRALLDTIAGGESPGYNAMYTGKGSVRRFTDFSDHPRSGDRISKGPNAGQTSSAAGRYQFTPSTWDRQAEKLGLPNFRPEHQDVAAADLAETTYGKRLLDTLKTGDDRRIADVGRGLNTQWTSLPGGSESTMSDRDFVDNYRQNLAKYKSEGRPDAAKKYGFSDDELGSISDPVKSEPSSLKPSSAPIGQDQESFSSRAGRALSDVGKSLADINSHLDPVKRLAPPAAQEVPKVDPDYKKLEDSLHTTLAPQFVDKVRNVYEAASPDERQRLMAQPGEVGAVAQYIDQKYQGADRVMSTNPDLAAVGDRREDITLRNRLNGMEDQTAKQMADREVRFNSAPITGQAQSTNFDFERAKELRDAGPIQRGAIQGAQDLKSQAAGLHFMAADLADSMGIPGAKGYGRAQLEARKKLQMGENEMGQAPNEFNRHLESAIRSTISNAPSLAAGVFSGGEAIPLLGLGAQVTGDEYANGVERGLSKEDALKRSVLFGSAEVLGEKFGFKDQVDLLKRASGGNWKNFEGLFVKNLGEQLAGEMGTTYAQFKTDKSKQFGLNQDATAKDLLNQMKDTVYQTVLQTSMMGAPGAIRAANSRLKESDAKHDQPFSDAFAPVNDTYRQIIGTRIGALRNDPEFKEIMRHETNIDLSGMERAKTARQILAERRSLSEVNKPSISGETNGQDANVSNSGNEGREGIPSEAETGRTGRDGRVQSEQESTAPISPKNAPSETQQAPVPVNLNQATKKGYTMLPSPEGIQIVDGDGNVISSHPKITDAIEAFDQLQANADNQQTQTATNKETSNELQITSKAGSESTRFQNPEGRRQQASKGTEQGSGQEALQEGNHGLKDREERASKLDLLAQEQDNLGNHSDAADWRQKAAEVRSGNFVPEAYEDANHPTGNVGEDVSGSSGTVQNAASGESGADVSTGSLGRGTPGGRSAGATAEPSSEAVAGTGSGVSGRALTAKEEGELRGHNTVLKKLGKPAMTPEQFLAERSAKLQTAASNRNVTDQEVVDAYNSAVGRHNQRAAEENKRIDAAGTGESKKILRSNVRAATTLPSSGSLQRRTAESIAKIFGHKVIFVESADGKPLDIDGSIVGSHPNHILLAADSKQSLSRVAVHEMVHGLRRNNSEIYGQLVRNLREYYNPIAVARHLESRGYASDLPQPNDNPDDFSDESRNEEEWVADHLSDIFHNHKTIQQLVDRMEGQKTGSGRAFLNHIKDFIDSLFAKLKGQGFGTEAAVARKHLKKSRDAVVEALAKYHAHQQGGSVERAENKQEPDANSTVSSNREISKASKDDIAKAKAFADKYGIEPYYSKGQLDVPVDIPASIKKPEQGKFGVHQDTGLPLNSNGTVTLYFPTTETNARKAVRGKRISASDPNANRIYLTNESNPNKVLSNPGLIGQGMDGANIMIHVDPELLQPLTDIEHKDGRKDFFIPIAEGEAFLKKMRLTKLFTLRKSRSDAISEDTTFADIGRGVTEAINALSQASAQERKDLVRKAKALLGREHNVTKLLTENGKLEKTRVGDYGLTYDGLSVASRGLGLASAQALNKKKLTTCLKSAICEALCLGETSGQNLLYGGEGEFRSGPRLSQYLKTEALVLHPKEFAIALSHEIQLFKSAMAKDYEYIRNETTGKRERIESDPYKAAIRLNVTSDFPPSVFKALIEAHPDVEFYDYTKLGTQSIAPNHHLTYSSTGVSQVVNGKTVFNPHSNWKTMVKRLNQGFNVAMAFTDRNYMPSFVVDEATGQRFKVWNGDNYDARFLDPKQADGIGMIVGLTNKDRTTPPDQAAQKHNGFFVHYDPEVDGDTVTIRDQSSIGQKPAEFDIAASNRTTRESYRAKRDARLAREAGDIPASNKKLSAELQRYQQKRGEIAMEKALNGETVNDAMYRPKVGSIAFIGGNKKEGIAHLVARRNAEGSDGYAIARLMPSVIANGLVTGIQGEGTKGERIKISYRGHTALLSLYRFGKKKSWLLSGWDEDGPEGVNPNRTYAPSASGISPKEGASGRIEDLNAHVVNSDDIPSSNRKNVLGDTPLATWTSPKVTPIDNLIYTLQDKLVDTKRVQEAITAAQRLIADEWNPYQKELLYHGRTAKLTDDFLSQEVRPLFKAMEEKGVSMDELEEYLHNRHAEERNNQIASINPGMPDGGSGIETQDALDYLGMLSFDKATDLEDLADLVDEISRGTKKLLVSSGLEAQQTIDAWDSAYQYYVPLQREELEVSPKGQGTGSGHSIKGSSSKRATGSKRKVVDILANLMMQRERAIVRSEKNKVATALYGLAIQNENAGFWLPVNPDAIKNPDQVMQDLLNMGLDPADIDGIMAEPTETVIDSKTGLVTHRINPRLRNMDNVLATRINGKDRFLFFSKEDERSVRMVAALKNLDEDGLGTILTYFRKVTRWISAINTQYNPVFGVVNLARDVQGGMLNLSSTPLAGKQLAVLKNVGPAMKGIYSDLRSDRKNKGRSSKAWSTLWEEYQNAGGRTGYRDAYRNSADRAEALKKEIARIQEGTLKRFGRGIFDWLSDYNDTLENAIRLSAYKVAKDNGMTKDQAAALAKSITVNFNKKGQIASQAGSLYAFFNAGIQGNFRLGQTLSGNAGKKIMAGGLILGAAQAALLAAAGFDDDEPPEFTKERNLIVPVGGSKYVTIPLPLGFHVIPNTSRILTELVIDQGKDAGDKLINLLGSFADAFDPMGFSGFSYQSLSPTAADPLVALAENRNSFAREIYKEDRSSLDPSPGFTRMKDTATGVSKVGAYVLNLISGGTDYKPGAFSPTPDQIDYLVGQATGGVGREVQKTAQFVSSTINGEDIPPHKIPLVGRFYGDAKSQFSETSRFYKNLKELNAHEREIKGRIKDGKDIKAYQEEHPEAHMVSAANNVEKMLTELKTRKRLMIAKGAPREEVKALEGEIASRIKQFNDDVKARSQK